MEAILNTRNEGKLRLTMKHKTKENEGAGILFNDFWMQICHCTQKERNLRS